ncbi:putative acetyltransferase [Bacilli bacterium PM5-3]|nr:putative acetyltransferase [Bacilli bacterium PM5-3]MDH6603558.1 putative acetyltransferase [Bacilli bacterium PM5-9]
MKIFEINNKNNLLLEQLLEIWEDSIRATHLFLSNSEINNIKQYVPQALKNIEKLIIVKDNDTTIAFMGLEDTKIEMLFVLNSKRNNGIGKKLINYGIKNYSIDKVSVNEQNPLALGFYEKMGFEVYQRNEFDEQGNPYPILDMKLNK